MLPTPQAPFQSASLYVGDLHADVTEGLLFELFNRVGPVASIRVCRDAVSRRSLGYAYVNFHNVHDAERALDTMNFTDIKNRPCRIMWSQRDPSLRKSGVGNVFVKNLAPSVDNKGLFDVFSVFGNILSCKVAMDENGNSKGYGYVHYETAEAAQDAVQKVNGNMLEDQEVIVQPFLRRQDRAGQTEWTNLYVKQFPTSWDEDKLKEIFGVHGAISSVKIARDAEEKSKGFGFVDFAEHTSAVAALEALSGKVFNEGAEDQFELYVNRAQRKTERSREMKYRIDALKTERISKYQGMNLYVKNLDDTINDESFREAFAGCGTITSAKVMRDEAGASRGFGFICFSSAEEANRAVTEMNGKMLRNKPLFVALHQRKDHRRAHLAASHNTRGMGGPRFPMGGQNAPMPYMYMNPSGGPMPPRQPFMMPGNMMGGPRGAPGRGGPPNMPGRGYPMPQYGAMGAMPGPGGFRRGQGNMGGMPGRGRGGPQGGRGGPARGPMPPRMAPGAMMQMPHASEPLDHTSLAQADPTTQKNMIGERLYPLIMQHQPDLAGKITGMLLEMDNAELLHLLESPEALAAKTEEAMQVLKAHQSGQQ